MWTSVIFRNFDGFCVDFSKNLVIFEKNVDVWRWGFWIADKGEEGDLNVRNLVDVLYGWLFLESFSWFPKTTYVRNPHGKPWILHFLKWLHYLLMDALEQVANGCRCETSKIDVNPIRQSSIFIKFSFHTVDCWVMFLASVEPIW